VTFAVGYITSLLLPEPPNKTDAASDVY